MYCTSVTVKYHDNVGYRNCLRQVSNMNMSNVHIPWDQMDNDLDDETKDELMFDGVAMTTSMDYIYSCTKNNLLFKNLYIVAASKMFSCNEEIGLAVLFSYDYFEDFHNCLVDFFNNCFSSENSHYLKLKNKIS